MSWTLTTSGAAIAKAGANANSTIVASGSAMIKFSDEAEGKIVAETRKTWVDSYSSLSDSAKQILDDVASSMIAQRIVNYDPSGYNSLAEAQTLLDFNDNQINEGMKLLKDFKAEDLQSP